MEKCNRDCFNCEFDDCINDRVYSEKSRYKNRSEQQKAYQRGYAKEKRDEARKKGLCIVCRKLPATHGAKCYECYLRQKRYDREKYDGRRSEWTEKGLCYYCGSVPVPGKRTCEKHYNILKKNIDICNQSSPTKEVQHEFGRAIWRSLDAARIK